MINYLGRYLPGLSTVLSPLNDLLKNDASWLWAHSKRKHSVFTDVKKMVTSPALAYFDPEKPTVVSADAEQFWNRWSTAAGPQAGPEASSILFGHFV